MNDDITLKRLQVLLDKANRADGELLAMRAMMAALIATHPDKPQLLLAAMREKERLIGVALGKDIPEQTLQTAAASFDALLRAVSG